MKSLSLALLPLILFATACGNNKPVISAELEPMVRDFIIDCTKAGRTDCTVYGIDSIKLVDQILDNATAGGVCVTQQVGNVALRYVQVRRDYCLTQPASCKAVVYHELGHCVLKQEHRKNSLMNWVMYQESVYEQRWEGFVTELFQWSK